MPFGKALKLIARDNAIALGAVKVGTYYTIGQDRGRQPFMDHYFNKDDREIGYFSYDMAEFCPKPLFVFDEPRVWGASFGNELVCESLENEGNQK